MSQPIHYAILRHPGHNQVYFQASAPLSLMELQLLNLPLQNPKLEDISGLSYLSFSMDAPLTDSQMEAVARLSSTYGLFTKEGELLRPVTLPDPQVHHRSVGTILKYQGKTNEIFTRMLLNIGYAQGNIHPTHAKVLDPVAGKGTTLMEAFSLGSDVYGVEVQEKSVVEGQAHLKKFLEQSKTKHKTGSIRVSGPNKSFTAKKHTIDVAVSPEKNQHFELIAEDSKYCGSLFSADFFHLIVGDLPYGVQHGNQAGGKHRSPAQLLTSCLRGWQKILRKKGVLVLSWNTLVLSREKMVDLLEKNGFSEVVHQDFPNMEHRVDASILRDVIVARKS